MIIGIVGPNQANHLTKEKYEKRIENIIEVSKIVAETGFKIVLTPDKNSLLELFGKEYIKNKGKEIIEIVPLEDNYEKYLNTDLGRIVSCGKWENQPSKFNLECDILLCIGYSSGTLSEIGASKYFKPKKIIVVKEFISQRLPKELELPLKIEYIEIKYLNKRLSSLTK